jgi:hypothetical protein
MIVVPAGHARVASRRVCETVVVIRGVLAARDPQIDLEMIRDFR